MTLSSEQLVAVIYAVLTIAIETNIWWDVWQHHHPKGGNVGYHYWPDMAWALLWPISIPINLIREVRRRTKKNDWNKP